MNYYDIRLSKVSLLNPTYNEAANIFESPIKYCDTEQMNFRTASMKIHSIIEHSSVVEIEIEFLDGYPKFYTRILDLDNAIISVIAINSNNWFETNTNYETVENLMKRTIRIPTTIPQNPTMSFYVSKDATVYDRSGTSIELSKLSVGNEIQVTLTLCGVQFYSNKYLILYVGSDIEVINDVASISRCLFDDPEETDLTRIDEVGPFIQNTIQSPEEENGTFASESNVQIDDSSELSLLGLPDFDDSDSSDSEKIDDADEPQHLPGMF